ncbi:ABC transporter ATP-binding protein [Gottschalkia purinilytica]|uniref:ABC transporter ATP-binding protein n=1 Tax=Gottschalkia purinilytica TaxID=1503 RepID=A0A0L0W8K4_GOTPU|nr:ABC transporter ATP-binding protein [Gottschalkia purinilytica]KNF07777.1 ABC transporter ATP-binding protein [Gottschalkia purinilytica]
MNGFRLLLKFTKGDKLKYIGSIICVALATIFSIIGPLVIRVTIDSIIGNAPINAPNYVVNFINKLGGKSVLVQNIWICGLVLVLLTIGRGIFLYFKGKWSAEASESIVKKMREKVYDHLQHLSYDYHVKVETGDLVQRCTSDIETIRKFLAIQLVEIGQAILILAFVLVIMFSLDTRLTIISMSIVPLIFIFGAVFFVKVGSSFELADKAEGRLTTVIQENLTGMRVVRAFGRQDYEIKKFDEKNRDYKNLTYNLVKQLGWYWSISDFLCLLQMAGILILGVYWVSSGTLTLGTLVAFISYESMLLWPVRQMGRIIADMSKSRVSLERIKEILDEPIEIENRQLLKPEINGDIEINNVTFEYEKNRTVLKDISFKVKKGQTIAILGPTGSGKTTLINLLGRLYDYDKGSIKINGVELKSIDKKWLRKHIGIVLQEPFLYAKSIKDNIGISKKYAKESDIFDSAKDACIHDVILDFEEGYDTLVGERGVTLSGGQKQRVSIARALINNYPILVFDDSLSAVDTETDSIIRKTLKERNKNTTTFIISHRVTTLAEADLIIVLEKGEISQIGTHDELMNVSGLYKKIWNIQNSLEDELLDVGV